jgi:hypothetical protein
VIRLRQGRGDDPERGREAEDDEGVVRRTRRQEVVVLGRFRNMPSTGGTSIARPTMRDVPLAGCLGALTRYSRGIRRLCGDTGVMVMDATNALAVIRALETQSVEVWLGDGGWGVDALLGEQTRPHKDVDLIVRVDQTENAVQALRGLDFVVAEGRLSSCFVLRDQEGRSVDVHPVVFDEEGNGDYTMENGEVWVYEASLQPRRGLLRRRPAQAR